MFELFENNDSDLSVNNEAEESLTFIFGVGVALRVMEDTYDDVLKGVVSSVDFANELDRVIESGSVESIPYLAPSFFEIIHHSYHQASDVLEVSSDSPVVNLTIGENPVIDSDLFDLLADMVSSLDEIGKLLHDHIDFVSDPANLDMTQRDILKRMIFIVPALARHYSAFIESAHTFMDNSSLAEYVIETILD